MTDPMPRSDGTPETALQALIAAVLRVSLKMTLLRAFRAGLPVAEQRRRLALVSRLTLVPRDVEFRRAERGGVAGEFVTPRDGVPAERAILYLHGGGYCTGSPATHRAITGRLAKLCRASVFAADYRLAPEHPFPAALDDAVAAYRGLLDEAPARPITVAGDSAGGGLSVAAALRLREAGLPRPASLVLLSPWVDLELDHLGPPPSGEVMITRPWIGECARFYLADHDARDPCASPVNADLMGLPPTLVQVGLDEVLLEDARRMVRALREAAVPVTGQEFPRRWHVFQANAGLLADANRALAQVGDFVRAIDR
ncbi:MAG TPA: alpha/beta hydrolase [Steroidobacteraceae bacterium]|nr:alpha/beta hydrolase [Steroidobacteraceae bacterium]